MIDRSRFRILIIDDDTAIVELLRIRLSVAGYQVLWARDGFDGVARAHKELPHGIVLDVGLPRMNGFQVLDELRSAQKTSGIPILMLTARHASGDVQEAMGNGASDFLVKPFDHKVLIARIDRLMRRHYKADDDAAARRRH